ncbi:hypothetical protein KFU94_30030 [Chloroflexi bacterium TSY]|nr:hypothetical protein [Chloroflexi bacterium TSY]
MQEIHEEAYQVSYNPETATVTCAGSFRLHGPEYAPILALMNEASSAGHAEITLDVRNLDFLNSSGINTLSKFVIGMRKKKESQLVVLGNAQYPWQKKSLKNLQRLLPTLKLEL